MIVVVDVAETTKVSFVPILDARKHQHAGEAIVEINKRSDLATGLIRELFSHSGILTVVASPANDVSL